MLYKCLVLLVCIAGALAIAGQYVPKSFYKIDRLGHKSDVYFVRTRRDNAGLEVYRTKRSSGSSSSTSSASSSSGSGSFASSSSSGSGGPIHFGDYDNGYGGSDLTEQNRLRKRQVNNNRKRKNRKPVQYSPRPPSWQESRRRVEKMQQQIVSQFNRQRAGFAPGFPPVGLHPFAGINTPQGSYYNNNPGPVLVGRFGETDEGAGHVSAQSSGERGSFSSSSTSVDHTGKVTYSAHSGKY